MNDYESYYTREFLFYYKDYKIIFFNLSLYITYLLQLLNVYIF